MLRLRTVTLLIATAVVVAMPVSSQAGEKAARILRAKKRVKDAKRVSPEVRQKVIDAVAKSRKARPGSGFAKLVEAENETADRQLPALKRAAKRLLSGPARKKAERRRQKQRDTSARRAERMDQIVRSQKAKRRLAIHGPQLIENLEDLEADGAAGWLATQRQGRDGGHNTRRTRIELNKKGATALGRKTVLHAQSDLPDLVVKPHSPAVSALRRKIVTELTGSRPVDGKARFDMFHQSKQGILWELPILLQRYVKLRDRAPKGQDKKAWFAKTKVGQLNARILKEKRAATLDDYVELGEVGNREMTVLVQLVLQDLGFEAKYAEGNLGRYVRSEVKPWYSRQSLNLVRTSERGHETWVQYHVSTEPWIMRTFNGQVAEKKFLDGRNYPSMDYIFWVDHKGPRYSHRKIERHWRQAEPLYQGENGPDFRFAENRPPPPPPRPKWNMSLHAEHENLHFGSRPGTQGPRQAKERKRHNARRHVAPKTPRLKALQVLNLPKTASAKDIKRRYRQLAQKHHPDTAGKSYNQSRWLAIQQAYERLTE